MPAARLAPLLVATLTLTALTAAAPPVFSSLDYDEALQASAEQGRLLIVDATASWCGPCKHMDRTTWVDPRVVEWIGAHAIAIQVDVDRARPVAQRLRVRAMPTLIVYAGGRELDRTIGFRDADAVLNWLSRAERARANRASRTDGADDTGQRTASDDAVIASRLHIAQQMARAGAPDAAAKDLQWVWGQLIERDADFGAGQSDLAAATRSLLASHAPARAPFTTLRNRLTGEVEQAAATPGELSAWMALNEILGDEADALRAVERCATNPDAADWLHTNEDRLGPFLESHERWDLLARIAADPAQSVWRRMQEAESGSAPDEQAQSRALRAAANLYAALLAAGRDDDAAAILESLNSNTDAQHTHDSLMALR